MSVIPPSALVKLRPQLTLYGARQILEHAQTQAAARARAVSIAVVDIHGALIAFARDDDASGVTINTAIEKARTAALLRESSKVFESFINGGLPSFLSTPDVTPLQGGVPVVVDGLIVGAVGVSGASGDEDAELATSAAMLFSRDKGADNGSTTD
ncbi:heme-binding protein [Kluyvera ascorbata]|uniref:GlcG/HbpS family heme-binding protein n=1 Tax=Kluyvera ascorbata TaxID=51288 RepID=UPI00374D27A3